ncbi:MAG: hypothetical protein RL172_1379 [Bacteroidota bacterium]|jgi:hypothetical protein
MSKTITIQKTTTQHSDFMLLVSHLDNELWNELKEDQAQYDQYNKVPNITTALVVYVNNQPAAIGCFKQYNSTTVEIKRMFVEKPFRGMGLSKKILNHLELWAAQLGYQYAVLETSIHFTVAINLYKQAGYSIIPNYDQYAGLAESVCMKKQLPAPSLFKGLDGIEYFEFEEDFMEDGMRCIPMIVRYKLDKAGIKLKLGEWAKFSNTEKVQLAVLSCQQPNEVQQYQHYVAQLVQQHTQHAASTLVLEVPAAWDITTQVPAELLQKAAEFNQTIHSTQWQALSLLQRFALVKLCRSKHENRNFPVALKEFGITI